MLELIKELLAEVWALIKKIIVAIIRFAQNIVSFFRNPSRLRKLQENHNRIAVAIKEKQESGDYQVVNCLYDKQTSELVTPEEDAEVLTSAELDAETKRTFNGKEMIVLQ